MSDQEKVASVPWYMDPDKFDQKLESAPSAEVRALARDFLDQGYVVVENSLSAQVCDETLVAFRAFEKANASKFYVHKDSDGHYPRMSNLHLALPALRTVFSENHAALELQDFLFEAETSLYTSLFYERGSAQPYHRDTPYFCTRPEYRYFGMWCALERVDEDNGPLMVMEGGHLMPELDREALALELFPSLDAVPSDSQMLWDTYQNRVADHGRQSGLKQKTVPVEKGSTILWHPQLPHGGSPIKDLGRTRFSLVMHTTPIGTPVYHQNVFYNPNKDYPTRSGWAYEMHRRRQFAKHPEVSFDHKVHHSPESFTLEYA